MENRKILKNILTFLSFFILVFIINYIICVATMDEIWTYGFSYNIVNGLIPYKDFNMIILPFHSLFMASLMKLIGSSFLIYHIICASLYSTFLYIISKKIGYIKTLFLIVFLVVFESYFYNPFLAFLLMMILLLERSDYKYRDLIIGLLIGYIMMTKVNIGAFLFLVFFFKSKNKLKSFLYSAIIPLFVLFYLIINNSLLQCFDYCVLGIKNFATNAFRDSAYLWVEVIVIAYIIFKIRRTKDKNYYYLLAFQMMCYPLCEFNHFVVAIYPLMFYLLLTLKQKNNILLIKMLIIIFSLPSLISFKFDYVKYDSFIGYRNFRENDIKYFDKVDSYINNNKDKKYFYLNSDAYFIRLNHNMRITKYDLINKGNMGSDEDKFLYEIDSICLREDCRILAEFLEYGVPGNQMSLKFKKFILDNYELCYDDFVYCRKINYCPKEKIYEEE